MMIIDELYIYFISVYKFVVNLTSIYACIIFKCQFCAWRTSFGHPFCYKFSAQFSSALQEDEGIILWKNPPAFAESVGILKDETNEEVSD